MNPVDDIRDIRPPVSVPFSWMWIVWVLALMGVVIAVYLFWKYLKLRKKIFQKLPHEIALEQLAVAARLIEENHVREFSFEVSEIVRIYIENRFQTRAAHRTTEEFLHELLKQKDTPLSAYQNLLKDFLNYCDLAKFGKWPFSQSEMQNMLQSACSFVTNTAPQPEEKKP